MDDTTRGQLKLIERKLSVTEDSVAKNTLLYQALVVIARSCPVDLQGAAERILAAYRGDDETPSSQRWQ